MQRRLVMRIIYCGTYAKFASALATRNENKRELKKSLQNVSEEIIKGTPLRTKRECGMQQKLPQMQHHYIEVNGRLVRGGAATAAALRQLAKFIFIHTHTYIQALPLVVELPGIYSNFFVLFLLLFLLECKRHKRMQCKTEDKMENV